MCNKDPNRFYYFSPVIFQEKPYRSSEMFLMLFLRQSAAKSLNRTTGTSLISILPYDVKICFWGARVR